MQPKAYIQTYGCQMNEHDSSRMKDVLSREGYAFTESIDEASLVLVNTCSVREKPEHKVYSFLGRLREMKQERPEIIVGVGGCVAQQEGVRILEREKAVDIVFGPDNFFRLPEMIEAVRRGERVLETKWQPRDKKVQNFIPEEWIESGHVDGVKAYIAITKGCDNFCTFCVVPYTRGREVSREPENIMREARHLISQGAKELWLLGQNVNSYNARGFDFYQLLDTVSRLDGLKRVRFTSPHPNDWNNRLSDLMAERSTICNQLHLPFQSGSDRMLQLMNRQHTLDEYLKKIRYMQTINPQIEISTDLIVGFPTETEDDFQQTMHVLEEVRFSQVYPFKYSTRPGTKAEKLDDDVPRELKEARLARVIEFHNRINAEKMQAYVGTTQEVLIDSVHAKLRGVMNGRSGGYRTVSVPSDTLEIGDIVEVNINRASGHWLYGDVVSPAFAAT
jgi:tRNA-2-methylthio-N6-dimethylallyladenosine synthase